MKTRPLMETKVSAINWIKAVASSSRWKAWTQRECNLLRFQILIPHRLFRPPEPLAVRPGQSPNSCGGHCLYRPGAVTASNGNMIAVSASPSSRVGTLVKIRPPPSGKGRKSS
jgi:hypothetical protein